MNPTRTQEVLKDCIDLYNSHDTKNPLLRKQLTPVLSIVEKEKKRLGIKNPRITMEQIGFEEINEPDNLYNMTKGNKVKISLMFRGREMAHPEIGIKMVEKMCEVLEDLGTAESAPKQMGRFINTVVSPGAKKK